MTAIEYKAHRLYYVGAMAEERRHAAEQVTAAQSEAGMYRQILLDLWEHPEFNQYLFSWVWHVLAV